jgi:hypothetical protein
MSAKRALIHSRRQNFDPARDHATVNGWEIVAETITVDQLVDRCAAGDIDVIVAASPSDVSRDPTEFVRVLDTRVDVSLIEGGATSDPVDPLMVRIAEATDEYETARAAAERQKRERGADA